MDATQASDLVQPDGTAWAAGFSSAAAGASAARSTFDSLAAGSSLTP